MRTSTNSWHKAVLSLLLLLATCGLALAQAGSVGGRIVGPKGEPLIGATAMLKGTTQGTGADASGSFKLAGVAAGRYTLVVSFVGYKTQEKAITVPGSENLTVRLADDASSLDEVLVTGVMDKRTSLESSIAVDVLKAKTINMQVPVNSIALLKNVPGVFVNSAAGEIRNVVYSRGISATQVGGSGSNGFYYVSLQEDGLPVTNVSSGNFVPDMFYRADATLGRLEALRGGTASITGPNAPGGIFNYVSKTGGAAFEGEVRAKVGLEGQGNPYYRADLNLGGPMAGGWNYNLGGFYRYNIGPRNTGYPMNNGGQAKLSVGRALGTRGDIRFTAKYLNDRNGTFQQASVRNFDHPELVDGTSIYDSYQLPPGQVPVPLNGRNTDIVFDPRNQTHSRDAALGMNLNYDLGKGWTITNAGRYSSKLVDRQLSVVVAPTPLNNLVNYASMGTLGIPGTYSFKDQAGNTLAQVRSFSGFDFNVLSDNLPRPAGADASLLFMPGSASRTHINEFIDNLLLNKKVGQHSISGGFFFAHSDVTIDYNGTPGVGFGAYQNKPYLLNISLQGADGKTYQVTSPQGYTSLGGGGLAWQNNQVTQNQTSFSLSDNWAFAEGWTLDAGARSDKVRVYGFNNYYTPGNSTTGGIDGNPLTIYDNNVFVKANDLHYDYTVNTVSYSAGLNKLLNPRSSVYARFAQGYKSPDLQFYLDNTTQSKIDNNSPKSQSIQQYEVGYKYHSSTLTLEATPFLSLLKNIPVNLPSQNADGTIYYTPYVYNSTRTLGLELLADYFFVPKFDVRAAITVQNARATTWQIWQLNQPGAADDVVDNSYSGNKLASNPSLLMTITPTYQTDKFFVAVNYKYMGDRPANVAGTFVLPAYSQFDFNIGYNFTSKLSVQGNINNLTNTIGAMNWYAPGGVPSAYNTEGFTPAVREKSQNANFSILSIQPRSFYLTGVYRF